MGYINQHGGVDDTGSMSSVGLLGGFVNTPSGAPATINLVGANSTQDATSGTGAVTVTPVGAATINLVGASCSQSATSSTGAATVTPAAGATINLTGANCAQAATSSTGAVTVTPAGSGLITSAELRDWTNTLQAGVTIPNVMVIGMDRTVILSLASQVTNGAGKLAITNAAIVPGTSYMLATFNADGSARGIKQYVAT